MLSCVEWLGVGSGGWIGVSCFRDIHPHIARRPREGGDPVRRGLSAQSLLSLEYWIIRFRG